MFDHTVAALALSESTEIGSSPPSVVSRVRAGCHGVSAFRVGRH
jgi:hypothetical protein